MGRPKYTKEEREIIKKWGTPCDKEYDTKRNAYAPDGGERITALVLAKCRRDLCEKRKISLVRKKNFKKAG